MQGTSKLLSNLNAGCSPGSGEKETQNVFQGDGSTLFSVKNDLFFRNEIDNLRSNLTRIWTCFVSIAWYQETCIWMSNGFMNATISFQKATAWSGTYQKSELIQGNQAFYVSCDRYDVRRYYCQFFLSAGCPFSL
jgi:hypothetical protein